MRGDPQMSGVATRSSLSNPTWSSNVLLRAAGVGLVLDCSGPGLPSVVHWGADLGDLDADGLAELARGAGTTYIGAGPDVAPKVSLIPESATGWPGLPGLSGHRDGTDFSPVFRLVGVDRDGNKLRITGEDPVAALAIVIDLELTESGLIEVKADLTNSGDSAYTLDGLVIALPVPTEATEILDFTGRWTPTWCSPMPSVRGRTAAARGTTTGTS